MVGAVDALQWNASISAMKSFIGLIKFLNVNDENVLTQISLY